jgi:hypothetical protein
MQKPFRITDCASRVITFRIGKCEKSKWHGA